MPEITREHLESLYGENHVEVDLDKDAIYEVLGTAVATYKRLQGVTEEDAIKIIAAAFLVWIEDAYNLNDIMKGCN